MADHKPESFIRSELMKNDRIYENNLRPKTFQEFLGQENVIKRLKIMITAATKRKEALGHSLFSGPPGLGKTTLAYLVAKAMNVNLITTSGPVIEKAADLAGMLTSLQPGDILFIDEIHRLSANIEEYLYSAMEDFLLDLMIDSGPSARSVQVKLNPFTLIGATTRFGLLSSPLRSRFLYTARLEFYSVVSLQKIIELSAERLQFPLDSDAALEIAKRSRGTPRIANNLLRWVRDYSETHNVSLKKISAKFALEALELLNIDAEGLDEMDKKILTLLIDQYDGGPVGIDTLGVALFEESDTLTEVHEPFLIAKGYIDRTPRGRKATKLAYEHLGRKIPQKLYGDSL